MPKDYGNNDYKEFVQQAYEVDDLGELEQNLFTSEYEGTSSEGTFEGHCGNIEVIMRGEKRALLVDKYSGLKVWVTEGYSTEVFMSIVDEEIRKRTGGYNYDDHLALIQTLEKNRDK